MKLIAAAWMAVSAGDGKALLEVKGLHEGKLRIVRIDGVKKEEPKPEGVKK